MSHFPRLAHVCPIAFALLMLSAGRDDDGPAPPHSEARQERLAERDRIASRVKSLQNEGKTSEAIAAIKAMLIIEKEVLGDDHEDLVGSLRWLAELYQTREDWSAAKKVLLQVSSLQIARFGRDDWRVKDAKLALERNARFTELGADQRQQHVRVETLNRTVRERFGEGRYDDAFGPAQEALKLGAAVLGEQHPDYAQALNNLGSLHMIRGDLDAARPLLERAAAMSEHVLDESHPGHADNLNNLAILAFRQGDLEAARPLLEKATSIYLETMGEADPSYANGLNNLAVLNQEQGDLDAARPLLERALRARRVALGEQHPDFAQALNNLGSLHMIRGDLDAARPLLERAAAIHREVLHERHPEYSRILNNLAMLHQERGDLDAARPLLERAADPAKGERRPEYAQALNNLGVLHMARGDLDAAQPLLERAADIHREATKEEHPSYATSMHNLGVLHMTRGDLDAARPLLERAMAVRREALGERHPDYARSLDGMAALSRAGGDLDAARSHLERALAVRREALGDRHPELVRNLNNLAAVCRARGDRGEVRRLIEHALDINEEVISRTFPALSERERLSMLASSDDALATFLSVTAGQPDSDETVYRHLLARKGLATKTSMPRDDGANADRIRELRSVLKSARARLNQLAYARVPTEEAERHARALRELIDRRQDLERQLAEALGWQSLSPGLEQVAAALSPRCAWIDIVRYRHSQPHADKAGEIERESRYAVFVLRGGGAPRRFDLGPADAIEKALDSWRARLQGGEDATRTGRVAAKWVWSPFADLLEEIDTVIVSPDAATCFLPWAALPDGDSGKYLIERYTFATVTSARQLVTPAKDENRRPGASSLLAVGGVQYGSIGRPETSSVGAPAAVLASRSAPIDPEELDFAPLPGTLAEAEAVAKLFSEAGGGPVRALSGRDATKAAVREAMSKARLLHLATHGYFAPPEMKSALTPPDHESVLASFEGMSQHEVTGWYPGLLSGLVWAGAADPPTNPATGVVDVGAGVMTAEEVAGLDLSGCELAVLSACETGLGRTAGGEGVLGLQRAFHQAGADTVVASLWRVDDAATRALMIRFYEYLWRDGLSPAPAMRRAQLDMLRGELPLGDDVDRGFGAPENAAPGAVRATARVLPRFWAAWIVSGAPAGGQSDQEPIPSRPAGP